jgi:hypothetical protein
MEVATDLGPRLRLLVLQHACDSWCGVVVVVVVCVCMCVCVWGWVEARCEGGLVAVVCSRHWLMGKSHVPHSPFPPCRATHM